VSRQVGCDFVFLALADDDVEASRNPPQSLAPNYPSPGPPRRMAS
jgi:hypothetical protein